MEHCEPAILTIGMVVRNGAEHIAAAIDSFRSQTFSAFELVIHDNASTDATPLIAQRYAAIDSRIRFVRRNENIGVLSNFIAAAESSDTPYFCWAAHDDVREPTFLERMLALLCSNPQADLACCAVQNMDPDGTRRELRRETDSLRCTAGLGSVNRLLMYLREAPGTPMYGVFRSAALRESLQPLRDAAAEACSGGPPLLGLDMVFLASFLRRHGMVIANEPLLAFRRGGLSHRIDAYQSGRQYIGHVLGFHRALARAVHDPEHSAMQSLRLSFARWRFLSSYLISAPMRRMSWHYFGTPRVLRRIHARVLATTNPAFRFLRKRAGSLPVGTRIIIFGGGKHTHRCFRAISNALGRRCRIVAICDDNPECRSAHRSVPLTSPQHLHDFAPDLVLVSSDTYEALLFQRAQLFCKNRVPVWCIYDTAIEQQRSSRSASSTDAMNDSSSSSESSAAIEPMAVCAGSE